MNASQYMKNVGKSLGYIAIDSFKQMNPAIAAVYDNAKEFTQDLYQTIDEFKGKAIGSDADSLSSKAKSTAVDTWKNAREDFLSGKWYNKERKSAASDEALKAMGFDFDFDFDFDLDDAFEEGTTTSTNVEEMEQSAKETAAVMGTIEGSVASAANSMVSATVKSTEYLASLQNANSSALYSLNAQGFNNVTLGLNAINANLSTMMSLAEPLTAHMQNSATFYAKSTEFQNKTINLLEQIVKNTTPAKPSRGSKGPKFEDYVNSGGIDFAKLFSDARESVAKEIKGYKEMLDMMGGGKGLISDITSSPISALISSLIIPALIPKGTKKRMKSLNDYIEVLGFNALNKYGRKVNDSGLGFLLDFLGFSIPTIQNKTSISTKGYEKGKVDWNGKSQKALMEVIPYYLSKMTAILDGSGEMEIFDYESGKFTTRKQINERFKEDRRNTASSYSYDFYGKLEKSSFKHKKEISKADIDELTNMLMLYGGTDYYLLFSPNTNERNNYLRGHKAIAKYLKDKPYLKLYIDKISKDGGTSVGINKYDLGNYSMAIGQAQVAYSNKLTAAEQSGEYDLLFNNSKDVNGKGSGLFGIDNSGYSALDYLRGIFINTSMGGTGGSGNGRVNTAALHMQIKNTSKNNRWKRNNLKNSKSTSSGGTSADEKEIIEELKNYYGKAWGSLESDPRIKDYLIKKKDAEKRGASEEFEEDDALEFKIKQKVWTNKADGFFKDIGLSDHIGNFMNKMGDILKTPTDIVNKALDAIKSAIHDIVFSEKGLMGWLFDKEHGKLRPAMNSIKNKFSDIIFGKEVPDDAVAETGPVKAYNGRMIRKTGLAAVSEGELIIPAEFNPYYSKPINKAKQIANENRAISRFYGAFDVGGTVGSDNKKPKREGGLVGVASNILQKGFLDFGQLLFQTFSRSVGIGDEKKEKEDNKKIQDVLKGALEGIKEHGGDAAVGALIGGGVSLLTGAAISPILGASLGAASGLVMSSDKVRTFLFGDGIDGGKEGLIKGEAGKKIRNFIESQLPDTLVGGALGGVGGALLGHPVLGMFLGSGIGFVTKSVEVQDFLFGKKNAEGGRDDNGVIPTQLQEQFKKALPGASTGAIAGLVASAFGGPFGLVGNMILGAGIGTVVTSEKFKNWFLGETGEDGKRKGGFVQELRDRVLDPSREMILNIGDKIRQDFRTVALNFSKNLTGFVKKLSVPIAKVGSTARKGIDWVGGKLGIPELSTKLTPDLRRMANRVRGYNLTRGYLSYGRDGKAMTAAERLAAMEDMELGEDNFGYSVSKMLAGSQRDDGSYRGLNRKQTTQLRATLSELSKTSDAGRRADIIKSNKLLSNLNVEDLSGSEIRKIQDSLKLEMGKKTPNIVIEDIGHDVGQIAKDIADMLKNGIPVINAEDVTSGKGKRKKGKKNKNGNVTQAENKASTNEGQQEIKAEQIIQEQAEKDREATNNISNSVDKLREDLAGKDENANNDKESREHGIFGKFFGENSIIGKAASMITKIGGIIAAGVIALATGGIFDDILAKLDLGWGSGSGGNSIINTVTGAAENVKQGIPGIANLLGFGRNGKGSNDTKGNYEDLTVSRSDTASFSERILGTIGRQGLRIAPALAKQAYKVIENQIINLANIIPKLPILKSFFSSGKVGPAFKEFFEKLLGQVDNVLVKASSDEVKQVLKTAATVVTIAFVIIDFTAGMQDAEVTMKVKNPSIPERILCGILRAVKNDVPGLGIITGLIPDSLIFDLLMATVGKALGLEDLKKRRDEAEAELAKYNEENGTDLTWAQYDKQVLDDKTWTERIGESLKTGVVRTVGAIKDPKQYMNNILSGTMEGWKSGNNLGGKLFGALSGLTDNALPGVIGELGAVNNKMWQYAAEGDVESLWKTNFEAFADEKDPISIMMSNIPLVQNKIVMTPIALLNKLIFNIRDGFKEFDFGDNPFASLAEDYLNINLHAYAGDMKEMWEYKPSLNTDNKLVEGIWKVLTTTQKVLNTPFTGITWVIKKIWNGFEKVKDTITDAIDFESYFDSGSAMVKSVESGDIKGLWDVPNPAEGKGGFAEGLGNVLTFASKVTQTPYAAMSFVGHKVGDFTVKTIKGLKKGFDYLKTEGTKGDDILYDENSSISDLFNLPELDNSVPLKGLFKAGAFTGRILGVGFEVVKGAIRTIADMIATSDFGQTVSGMTTNGLTADKYMITGDFLNLWRMQDANSASGGFWKFLSGADLVLRKVMNTPIALVSRATQDLVAGIKEQVEPATETFSAIGVDASEMWSHAIHGEIVDFLGYETSANQDGSHPMWGALATVVGGAMRFVMSPIALITAGGGLVVDKVKLAIDDLKTAATFAKDQVKFGIDLFENDPLNWETKILEGLDPDAGPLESMFQLGTVGLRYLGAPIVLTKMIGKKVGSTVSNIFNPIKTDVSTFSDSMLELTTKFDDPSMTYNDIFDMNPTFASPIDGIFDFTFNFSKILYGAMKLVTGFVGDLVSGFNWGGLWDNLKSIASFKKDKGGSGSGIGAGSSGFISQNDPRYAGKGLGGSSVGEIGCGPAAASMVLGNNMSSNINLARKYQTAGGTDLSYFADVFARNGKSAKYYNLGGGASGADMVSDIASGKPVVLMGRDPYNTSKRFSPFGPNNHYVVARGFRNGGVVIDDPEMKSGGRLYSTNILRNVTAAVGAGRSGLTGIGAGAAMIDNANAKQAWAFFKSKGYSDGAAAGVLANIQAESSFRTGADNPTDAAGGSHGLCQWNGGRWTALKNLAKTMGKSEFDLDVQLEHLHSEIGQAGAGYTSLSDPAKAAEQFCRKFERPKYPDAESKKRAPIAVEFYNAYSGKTFEYNGSTSSSGDLSSLGTGFSASKAKPMSKLQKMLNFTSTIGEVFNKVLFGKGSDTEASNIGGLDSSGISGDTSTGEDISVQSWPGKQPVEYMRDVLGKLKYSKSNRDPDKGGGDCSSTVAWALTKAGLPVTSDSRWQYMNSDLKTHPSWQNVIWYDGGNRFEKRNPGKNVEDLVHLKPNDVIFYSWKNSKSTYPDHVDHVEMYNGNNELIGNGGGVGTRTRSVHDMQGDIIKIARPKLNGASGSGLLSGINIKQSPSTVTTGGKVYNLSEYRQIKRSGGASALNSVGGGIDKNTALILKSMIALIESIVKNTNDISSIYEVISAYCSSNPNAKSAEALSKIAENKGSDNSDVEVALADLKATVNSILAS